MGAFVAYSDTTASGLLIFLVAVSLLTATVLTVDPYACTPKPETSSELVLNCTMNTDLVVTGFIRGGHVKQVSSSKKQKKPSTECSAPDGKTDCWANPINGHLLSTIQNCLWKMSICRIPVNGQLLGHPCFARPATYIFAEQFKCIDRSRIVHLCSSSNREQQLSVKASDEETFILSKGYPEIVYQNLSCSLTITTDAESLHFESIYMHIHPKRKTKNTCDVDYLDIKKDAGSTAVGIRFCGREKIDYTSSSVSSRVQFVSGPERKHYGGFVVRVTAVSTSARDQKAPVVTVSSPDFNKVKNPPAAAANKDKNKKVSEARAKSSTKTKS